MKALLGILAVAVAAWLIPASVHIVEWTADGPHRLGLFASRGRLIALVAAGLVAAALLLRRRGGRVAYAWLALLWLWVVPFLPWLPDRFPLLLVLAGPLRWVVAAVAVAGIVWSSASKRDSEPWVVPSPRRAVFIASLALYLILGALHARAIGPGGDEPHYLVIAHSLLSDGDLLIENNHVERDYVAFWAGPPLRPDYMKRGLNGEIYSIHAPGLPVVMLPAYAVAGYGGVVVLLCLLAALASLAIFDLAADIAGVRAAVATWIAVCLTVPFMPHAWLIYPELPGALIVAWAVAWVWRQQDSDGTARWFMRGALLGVLPWLHTKFVIFLAVFGGMLILKLRRRPRAMTAFAAPAVASVAAWLISFYVIYGTLNPEAPYGDYTRLFVLVRNIPRGLLGILFDQKFGLLVYAPVYLFAVAGFWMMLRRPELRWLGAVALVATALHVGSTTRLYMWWGGNSAPARFLLPILPCLAPAVALAAARLHPVWRALFWTTVIVSVGIGLGGLIAPERLLLFSDPRGKGRIIELVQGPAPLSHLLPTFAQENWRGPLVQLLPWLLAAGVTAAAIVYLKRRDDDRSPLWIASSAALIFLSTAAVAAVRVPDDGQDETVRRGAMETLWRYDPQRLRPLDYRTLQRLNQDQVFALSTTTVDLGEPTDSNQRIISGPLSLPAGSYQARVWFAEGAAHDGEIVVSASDRAVFARQDSSVQNPLIVPFQLPIGVRRLTIAASQSAARHAVKVELRPDAIVPPGERETAPVRAIESVPEHPGAYVAYLNEHAYPEGGVFWTRGTGRAAVLVAPGGARRLTLTLFSGPTAADCTVTLLGEPQTVKTAAGQTSTVSFVVPENRRVLPLEVQASAFFRPSEVDSGSTDNRGLGCQVRIGLE